MPQARITQAFVDGLKQQDATVWYHDTTLAGFNLAVGRQTKTFYAGGESKGRFTRIKIARADVVSVATARELARNVLLPEIRAGVDPRTLEWSPSDDVRTAGAQEAQTILRSIRVQEEPAFVRGKRPPSPMPDDNEMWTLEQACHVYQHTPNAKGDLVKTRAEYGKTIKRHADDWWLRTLNEISASDVATLHRWIVSNVGPSAASQFVRHFAAVMNHAVKMEIIERAPMGKLPSGSFTSERNPTRISDVWHWWREVDRINDLVPKSILKVSLLTGLRTVAVKSLRWQDVDFDANLLTIHRDKTGAGRTVVMSPWTSRQLKRVWDRRDSSFWVFPANTHTGYVDKVPTITYKDQRWTPSDTREEFISVGAEIGVEESRIWHQLGHRANSMTRSYVVSPNERAAVEAIADEIMRRVEGAV